VSKKKKKKTAKGDLLDRHVSNIARYYHANEKKYTKTIFMFEPDPHYRLPLKAILKANWIRRDTLAGKPIGGKSLESSFGVCSFEIIEKFTF